MIYYNPQAIGIVPSLTVSDTLSSSKVDITDVSIDNIGTLSFPNQNKIRVFIENPNTYGNSGTWIFKKKDGTNVILSGGTTGDMGAFYMGDLIRLLSTTYSTSGYSGYIYLTRVAYTGSYGYGYTSYVYNYTNTWSNANTWIRVPLIKGSNQDGIIVPHIANGNATIFLTITQIASNLTIL